MENPFIITGKIKPEYFCDREVEAERIIRKVTLSYIDIVQYAMSNSSILFLFVWIASLLLEEYKKYLL